MQLCFVHNNAHFTYLEKNSHLFTVKQVLNFTLGISDGLIINRFTQRDEKSRILLKQFTFHLIFYHKIN